MRKSSEDKFKFSKEEEDDEEEEEAEIKLQIDLIVSYLVVISLVFNVYKYFSRVFHIDFGAAKSSESCQECDITSFVIQRPAQLLYNMSRYDGK